jgi:hypothetical protein
VDQAARRGQDYTPIDQVDRNRLDGDTGLSGDEPASLRPHSGVELEFLAGTCMTAPISADGATLDPGEDRLGEALLK